MDSAEPDGRRRPPADVLPAIVPAGRFLIRTERLIVALSHLEVYPNGSVLAVLGCERGPGVSFDNFDHLAFEVRFGADISARLYDKTAPQWLPDGSPALMLMSSSMEGSATDQRADCTLRLWISPLPPPEPGTLSVFAPQAGSGQASCPLDGRAIAAAAAAAQPYWR